VLVLQSEVHGILSPCRSDRDFAAPLLIVLSEGTWRKACGMRDDASNDYSPPAEPPPEQIQ
jgi:hypothetical protein